MKSNVSRIGPFVKEWPTLETTLYRRTLPFILAVHTPSSLYALLSACAVCIYLRKRNTFAV